MIYRRENLPDGDTVRLPCCGVVLKDPGDKIVCACPEPGRLLERATKAVGVKPCAGCRKRSVWISRAYYKVRDAFRRSG